jgi:hypothetical protein
MISMTCRFPNLSGNGVAGWNGQRWVTGEKAEMGQEDIDRELFELACEWMAVSKLRKLPGHVAKEPMLLCGSSFASTQSTGVLYLSD